MKKALTKKNKPKTYFIHENAPILSGWDKAILNRIPVRDEENKRTIYRKK